MRLDTLPGNASCRGGPERGQDEEADPAVTGEREREPDERRADEDRQRRDHVHEPDRSARASGGRGASRGAAASSATPATPTRTAVANGARHVFHCGTSASAIPPPAMLPAP